MVNIIRIEGSGDQMILRTDEGTTFLAYPTGRGVWILREPLVMGETSTGPGDPGTPSDPGPGPGGGGLNPPPDSLSAKDTAGVTHTFGKTQMQHAYDILKTLVSTPAYNTKNIMRIVLITTITEGNMWMYSNTSHYPETAGYPHELNGKDHDSVGMFQQRPSQGWGTPKQCMTIDYSVKAFLGGPTGPNGGNPRGLFDIKGWEAMTPGKAAQTVQGSAFPLRYDQVVQVADAIIKAIVK